MEREISRDESSLDLVYSEIRDLLRRQESILDRSRGVAGTLLAAAAFALSFLGGTVLDRHDQPGAGFWVGALLIMLAVMAYLWVLTPLTQRKRFLFSPEPKVLLEDYLGRSASSAQEHLARYMAGWIDENEPSIARRYLTLTVGTVLLGAGIFVLLATLGGLI